MLLVNPEAFIYSHEPIRASWWSLSITSPIGAMPEFGTFSIKELPSVGNQQDAVSHVPVNVECKYPGIRRSSTQVIRIALYENDPVFRYFVGWRNRCVNPDTTEVGLLSEVAGTGRVRIYTTNGSGGEPVVSNSIRLETIWPSAMEVVGLDHTKDGDQLEYSVTLEIGNSVFES